MVFNREEVVRRALASHTNTPDTCQLWTRTIIGVASAGDFDGDGAADAEDGWKLEPARAKHPGDRTPPAGVPVSYLGGSKDNGHRAVSLGGGMIRSTDAGGRGIVATVPLDFPETHWGLTYAGWSSTCDGVEIPLPPKPPVLPPMVKDATHQVWRAKHQAEKVRQPVRLAALKRALAVLRSITFRKPTKRSKR